MIPRIECKKRSYGDCLAIFMRRFCGPCTKGCAPHEIAMTATEYKTEDGMIMECHFYEEMTIEVTDDLLKLLKGEKEW